jgi:hypothetical protein
MSLENPVDGEIVEFWAFDLDGGGRPYLGHYRSTFHVNTPWDEHPWGARREGFGLAFVNQWSTECWDSSGTWCSNGRADTAWLETRLAQEDVFTDFAQARAYAITWCTNRVAYLHSQIEELTDTRVRFAAGKLR